MKSIVNLKVVSAMGVALMMTPGWAATLSSVPMQGGMVMPMIHYSAAAGTLSVMVNPTVPELTPLLVSNPGDGFAAGDPWYDCLDPSRQGLAFSRRYGFVMDVATDPVPAGTAIWIRKLSSTPGLEAYRYRNTDPKAWEPIFGTKGSADALEWNGMMFHPGFTAPPGSASYEAEFEAVLVVAATGEELAGSSTGAFTLSWTTVPDGRPVLTLARKLVLAWLDAGTPCVLESADALDASDWTPVETAPVVLDGEAVVILEPSAARRFYRVRILP